MEDTAKVIEYKCPCCNAGLSFAPGDQQLKCAYCENTFDLDTTEDVFVTSGYMTIQFLKENYISLFLLKFL